jgi:hypothetical protein
VSERSCELRFPQDMRCQPSMQCLSSHFFGLHRSQRPCLVRCQERRSAHDLPSCAASRWSSRLSVSALEFTLQRAPAGVHALACPCQTHVESLLGELPKGVFSTGGWVIHSGNVRSVSSFSSPKWCRRPRITPGYSPLSRCHHGLSGLAIGSLPRYSGAWQFPPPSSLILYEASSATKKPLQEGP